MPDGDFDDEDPIIDGDALEGRSFSVIGPCAASQGGYWLSGKTLSRTREDLYRTFRREWIFRSHGRATIVHVFDVETTGLKPEKGDRAVEVAATLVAIKDDGSVIVQQHGQQSFVNPHRDIPPEASGIHHIVDDDVLEAPGLCDALALTLHPFGLGAVDVCAAHSSDFDRSFLPLLDNRRWIDTCRCAKHLWPDAPNFKNQTLRYWLDIDLPRNGDHRALEDATVTAHILAHMLRERSVDELLDLSQTPALLHNVHFGKYYGQPWSKMDIGFLNWILGKAASNEALRAGGYSVDLAPFENPDVIFTAEAHREKILNGHSR